MTSISPFPVINIWNHLMYATPAATGNTVRMTGISIVPNMPRITQNGGLLRLTAEFICLMQFAEGVGH